MNNEDMAFSKKVRAIPAGDFSLFSWKWNTLGVGGGIRYCRAMWQNIQMVIRASGIEAGAAVFFFCFLSILGGSLLWNLTKDKSMRLEQALHSTRVIFKQIILQRAWNADLDGIYSPVSGKVQPNPYLRNKNRDLTTREGVRLTMINPSYMTRQLAELSSHENGVQYHITSLKPIRLQNEAHDWEKKWLTDFEKGAKEKYALVRDDTGDIFRYMAPLYVEMDCLSCHAEQGYKEGDVRGGISVTMPLPELQTNWPLWTSHGIVGLFGGFGIWCSLFLLTRRERRLEESNQHLEKEIVERQQSEEKLRHAEQEWHQTFNSISDFVSVHDMDYRFVKVNKALADYLGASEAELVGRHCFEVLHDMKEPWQGCPHGQSIATLKPAAAKVDDPHIGCPLMVTTSPTFDENNAMRGTVHIARDIRDLLEAEQRESDLSEQLVQAQKMEAIGTLAGGIAHDFNNLLTPILGYAELALMRLPPEGEASECIRQQLDAIDRTRDLVRQILLFSRKSEKEFKALFLPSIVKETARFLRSAIPSSIEIRPNIDADTGYVFADATQIHQVVMNICTNAWHAMEGNNGLLEISLDLCEIRKDQEIAEGRNLAAGSYARLTIADNGCGMIQELLGRIFEPYYTTKAKGKGTGLGLSIVHGIIKDHGGSVTVESEVGTGTSFTIYLPSHTPLAEGPPCHTKECLTFGKGEHILLVDDSEIIVELHETILSELGYHVTSEISSSEALRKFQADPEGFDLVITDLTMPAISGAELASEVKALRPDLPVILCSGNSAAGEHAGINKFLLKPVRTYDLASVIRRLLDEEKIEDS